MSKTQGSNVDGRCDGDEMSIRDQRVGTSYSDKVKEVCRKSTSRCRNKLIPLTCCVREANELGGLVEILLHKKRQ